MSDAAFDMYLKLLFDGADEGLRKTALHFVAVCALAAPFVDASGLYRVGLRRWRL